MIYRSRKRFLAEEFEDSMMGTMVRVTSENEPSTMIYAVLSQNNFANQYEEIPESP